MGVLFSPLLRVPPKLPHRKYFRRGPRPFPPKGPHGFRGHLTRLTLCVAIAIPSVRRDAIGAERSNRWTFGSQLKARVYLDLRRCDAINATRNDRWTFGSALTLRAATCKRGRKFAHGASLAERRVKPSPKKFSSGSNTSPNECTLVSGSTSNEITSCLRASRSECSLNRLRKRNGVLEDACPNANSLSAIFGCRTRKHPRLSGSPQSTTAQRGHFVGKRSNRAQRT